MTNVIQYLVQLAFLFAQSSQHVSYGILPAVAEKGLQSPTRAKQRKTNPK
jgi:hypothetical protein